MKYAIIPSNQFRKDLKRIQRRHLDLKRLTTVINQLASGETLPDKYRDHVLVGAFLGCRECHIRPDWLLIYRISEGQLQLVLLRTGTHSDLF